MNDDILKKLYAVLEQRKQAEGESSYVASLYERGLDTILKKTGEESAEVIIAAKGGEKDEIVHEVADLWFHCMVLLAQQEIHIDDVLAELDSRFGVSGHDEKARRTQHQ